MKPPYGRVRSLGVAAPLLVAACTQLAGLDADYRLTSSTTTDPTQPCVTVDSPHCAADKTRLLCRTVNAPPLTEACPQPTPFCSNGACVACNRDRDCDPGCASATCVEHVCKGRPKTAGTVCGGGVCDGQGACLHVTELALGSHFSCALTSFGTVKCWGQNSFGQLGTDDVISRPTPRDVVNLSRGKSLAAGSGFVCAVLDASPFDNVMGGSVRCWGLNNVSQLGLGTDTPPTRRCVCTAEGQTCPCESRPRPLANLDAVERLSLGSAAACAQRKGSKGTELRCWGMNSRGLFGQDLAAQSDQAVTTPQTVAQGAGSLDVSVGVLHMCLLLGGRNVGCWGTNSYGQVGVPPPDAAAGAGGAPSTFPKTVAPLPAGGQASAVVVGDNHSCAVVNGSALCWGRNEEGELGRGAVSRSETAGLVSLAQLGPAVVAQVSIGNTFSCLRAVDGRVACWGRNDRGQLGYETPPAGTAQTRQPSATPGIVFDTDRRPLRAQTIGTGEDHACAVLTGGDVVCWGNSDGGALGRPAAAGGPAPGKVQW